MKNPLGVITVALIVFGLSSSVALASYCPPKDPPVVSPPAVAAPRCQPGYGPYGGKDGDESDPYHNQECCPDADSNQQCDDVTPVTAKSTQVVQVRLATRFRMS